MVKQQTFKAANFQIRKLNQQQSNSPPSVSQEIQGLLKDATSDAALDDVEARTRLLPSFFLFIHALQYIISKLLKT